MVSDVMLAGIKEGKVTIDPWVVLECAVLLDHGRFLALVVNERAAYGYSSCVSAWLHTKKSCAPHM